MNELLRLKILKTIEEKVRNQSLFQNLITNVYSCTMFIIILICALFPRIEYANKNINTNFFPSLLLIMFGFVFGVGLYSLVNYFGFNQNRRIIILASISLFFLQSYSVYNYYFYTDWDVAHIMKFSDLCAHNQDINGYTWYFSIYPNNLFLAWIFSSIRSLAHNIGLHEHEYFIILLFQCFLNTITGYILFCIIDRSIKDIRFSIFGYIIYTLLIGISPWISIPYSDSAALIFPSLIIYMYICKEEKVNATHIWLLMGICSAVGYKIKPQTFIVFIVVVLVETFKTTNIYELKKIL